MPQFRQAGLVTFCRTSTAEMAFATTTKSVLYGITRNPWNLALSAGDAMASKTAARVGS